MFNTHNGLKLRIFISQPFVRVKLGIPIGTTTKTFSVAATIACPISSLSSLDQAEIMLISDNARTLIYTLYRQLLKDSIKELHWLRNISKFEISPFVAPDLSASYGYTLSFDVNYK